MRTITAILGKSGVGKTFLTAQLGMALGRMGVKTLLVGADQKKDLSRSLGPEQRSSLMEALESAEYRWDDELWESILLPISPYVDVMELGPSAVLSGNYANVLEVAFSLIRTNPVMDPYEEVLMDVTDERFDAATLPLFADSDKAIAVTDGSPESLFVMNRLFRAVLIGAYENGFRMRMLGAVLNRMGADDLAQRYVAGVQCKQLLTVPADPELNNLRGLQLHVFAIKRPGAAQRQLQMGVMGLADHLRGRDLNLMPLKPITDEEFWSLEPEPAAN